MFVFWFLNASLEMNYYFYYYYHYYYYAELVDLQHKGLVCCYSAKLENKIMH